jgi:transcriptional regulator with XRE-family HTH domain
MKTKKKQNQVEIPPATLKSWRLESKYSIPQAARLIGANRATWERWEKGITEPSEEYVARLTALIREERDLSNISSDTLELMRKLSRDFDHIHSQLARLAFGSDEYQAPPFRSLAKGGPNRDSSTFKLLEILFASLYKSEKRVKNRTRILGQIKYLMGFAGYFVGRLKYSVDDFEGEDILRVIASIISDLLGLRALLKKDSPKYADDLWIAAFNELPLGYCLALDQQFWPTDNKREEVLLACAINNQRAFEYIVSNLSPEDLGNPVNEDIFAVINVSRGAKEAKEGLGEDTTKRLDEIWSKLNSDPGERLEEVLAEALDIVTVQSLMRRAQSAWLTVAYALRDSSEPAAAELLQLKSLVSTIESYAKHRDKSNQM